MSWYSISFQLLKTSLAPYKSLFLKNFQWQWNYFDMNNCLIQMFLLSGTTLLRFFASATIVVWDIWINSIAQAWRSYFSCFTCAFHVTLSSSINPKCLCSHLLLMFKYLVLNICCFWTTPHLTNVHGCSSSGCKQLFLSPTPFF